jgi:hypothetical protein
MCAGNGWRYDAGRNARRDLRRIAVVDVRPVCLNRPVFMLSTGMSTLLDKQIRYLGATRLTFWVAPELADFCRRASSRTLKIPSRSTSRSMTSRRCWSAGDAALPQVRAAGRRVRGRR